MGMLSAPNSEPDGVRRASRTDLIRFVAALAGIALLIFAYFGCTWGNFIGFKIAISTCSEPFCDFADYYYLMGETVFRSGLPVTGFMYSPFIAILLAVFSPLGFNTAVVL